MTNLDHSVDVLDVRWDRRKSDRAVPSEAWSEREILAEAELLGRVGAWAWQISQAELWWSDGTFRIFGLDRQNFLPSPQEFLACVHPDDQFAVRARIRAAIVDGEPFEVAHRLLLPTGEIRHVREHGRITRNGDGRAVRMVGFVQDVTDELQLKVSLAASEARFRMLAEHAWDTVWALTPDGSFTYVSPSEERMRGFTPQEAMQQTFEEKHPPESLARVQEYLRNIRQAIDGGSELPAFHGELEMYRKDGSIMLGEFHGVPQVDEDGCVHILGVTRDISERRELERQLSALAMTDPLTGIWNRRHGETQFMMAVDEGRRYGSALSILMLDVDHFKSINDVHGHHVGDNVLIETARRISEHVRTSDHLVRWGGEEFVILMRQSRLEDALVLAEKIRALMADEEFACAGTVTVSIGVAELRREDDLGSMMRRADLAMYEAKASGRNAVRAQS